MRKISFFSTLFTCFLLPPYLYKNETLVCERIKNMIIHAIIIAKLP